MRTPRRTIGLLAVSLVLAGCQGAPRRMAAREPSLDTGTGSGGTAIVQADPPKSPDYVDRHPMLAAPRDYYNNTNSNKAVKVAAATVVGVPVGLFGEVKQIVVGAPPDLRGQ